MEIGDWDDGRMIQLKKDQNGYVHFTKKNRLDNEHYRK